MLRWLLLIALLLLPSCYTFNGADLLKLEQDHGLEITEGPPPEGAQPIKILSVYKSGFYLLGLLPIVDFDDTFRKMRIEARKLGADGISHVTFEHSPAGPFKFAVFPIPDWSAWIHAQGMAWRYAPGTKPRPSSAPKNPSLAEPSR